MTRDEAARIRERQINGEKVNALDLQMAIDVLQKVRIGRPYKFRLPDLPRPVRERVNAMLCFNLGLALGKGRA